MHLHTGRDLSTVACDLGSDSGTLSVIIEAFEQKLNHDIRDHKAKPLFQTGKASMESLNIGDNVTGVVS